MLSQGLGLQQHLRRRGVITPALVLAANHLFHLRCADIRRVGRFFMQQEQVLVHGNS
jgi:hypothetical protein